MLDIYFFNELIKLEIPHHMPAVNFTLIIVSLLTLGIIPLFNLYLKRKHSQSLEKFIVFYIGTTLLWGLGGFALSLLQCHNIYTCIGPYNPKMYWEWYMPAFQVPMITLLLVIVQVISSSIIFTLKRNEKPT